MDKWWQSNIPHTFVIGEMAGTHGVKRPGGSALNSGQVGGLRAAEYIVNVYGTAPCEISVDGSVFEQIESAHAWICKCLANPNGVLWSDVQKDIQVTMSASAGHVRRSEVCREAKDKLEKLYKAIRESGLSATGVSDLPEAVRTQHLVTTALAFLASIEEYLRSGGGSRGSFVVVADDGEVVHHNLTDPATGKPLRVLPENTDLRTTVAELVMLGSNPPTFCIERVAISPIPQRDEPFELAWRAFRDGEVYRK